jgi:hypothetical protein
MLEIFFDDSCHFIEGDVIDLIPIFKNIEDFINSWPKMRVGGKQMPHQILHLLADLTLCVLDIGVDYAELSLLLERMEPIVEDVEHTA